MFTQCYPQCNAARPATRRRLIQVLKRRKTAYPQASERLTTKTSRSSLRSECIEFSDAARNMSKFGFVNELLDVTELAGFFDKSVKSAQHLKGRLLKI